MVQQLPAQQLPAPTIIYPDSDGRPMADDTEQFRWIVTIKENLELLYADDPTVLVAGDLLWYPVEGDQPIPINNGKKTALPPRWCLRFSRPVIAGVNWEIYRPDGSRFLTFVELGQQLTATPSKADRLAARLQELGIDPAEI